MTEAAAAAPPRGPRGWCGGRPLAARRGGAALRSRSRSRRRRCCPSSPCPRRSPARSLAPFSLRFRLKGGEGKGARPPFSQCRRHRRHRSPNRRENKSAVAKPTRLAAAAQGRPERALRPGRDVRGWRPGCGLGLQTAALVCAGRGGGFTLCPRPPDLPARLRSPAVPRPRRSRGRPEKGPEREEKAAAPRRLLPLPLRLAPPPGKSGRLRAPGGRRAAGPGRSRRRAPPPAAAGPRRPGRGLFANCAHFVGLNPPGLRSSITW